MLNNAHVLIVDDVAKNIQVLGTVLRGQSYKISYAQNGKQAVELAKKKRFDLILLDIMMPELDGFGACKALKQDGLNTETPVIFLTAKIEKEEVVKGFEIGAVDYISKPFNSQELLSRVHTHLTIGYQKRKIEEQKEALSKELEITETLFAEACYNTDGELLGSSEVITKVRDSIAKYASDRKSVFLIGETECAEEAIARTIHKLSKCEGAFIQINCNAFKVNFFEKALSLNNDDDFIPKVLLATCGTLFLENIYELPTTLQESLLEILKQHEINIKIVCYGGSKAKSNLHSDLNSLLSKHVLHVPTLLERREDIPILIDYYIKFYAQQRGKKITTMDEKSLKKLSNYSWPGNTKELKNLIERSVTFSSPDTTEVVIDDEWLAPGIRIDNYRLIEKIGQGGMGEVWRAKHHALVRPVVIKRIQEELQDKNASIILKRFEREAQTIARLQSPHTITLYDYGIDQSNSIYYAMEMLYGLDLDQLVLNHGSISPQRAVYILSQVCLSLMEAHSNGIIHRDIKPSNIFLCKLGWQFDFIKVLDFGIVKKVDENSNLTGEYIVGSPLFMAPELAYGKEIDESIDVYSFGCVAYHLLAGRHVFTGNNPMYIIQRHVNDIPEPISQFCNDEIPKDLENLIMQCLQKKAEKRPSIHQVKQRLSEISFVSPWTCTDAQQWWERQLPDIASS
ncbi:protein kinase [Candidatus Uabimicrobium sp. HlEnr_7]|uniref:protein kinase domain-containing protein n=1 Tax=Candidatus Uabimicrobium helgolandensis TaxID=3095367 RepID=UPI0035579288